MLRFISPATGTVTAAITALRLRLRAAPMATLARATIVRLSAPRPPVVPAGHAFPHVSAAPPRVPTPATRRPSPPAPTRAGGGAKRYYSTSSPRPRDADPHAHAHAHVHNKPLTGEPPAGASGSHMNGNIPEGLDEALRSRGKRWVETAASDSEAIVKAERSGNKKASIKQLQRDTVRGLQQD